MHYTFEPEREERHIMSVDGAEIRKFYDVTAEGYRMKPELKEWLEQHDAEIHSYLSTVDEFDLEEDEDGPDVPVASVHFKNKDSALKFKLTFG